VDQDNSQTVTSFGVGHASGPVDTFHDQDFGLPSA
jgi:hypothetical protein